MLPFLSWSIVEYAEVVSEDEYNLAKRMGVAKNRIIYNGPIKTKGSFLEAVSNGCIVNVDSQRELDWIGEIATDAGKIGLRVNFDIEKIPLDDKKTFSLLCEAKTNGVFQLESGGMKQVLQKLRPNCLEDVIACVAL